MSFFSFWYFGIYLLLYISSQYDIVLLKTLYCLNSPISNRNQQKLKMANQELYKQAIADAKKLKDISMAQAKEAIAEAFNPKIQEMFRLKLSELEEEDLEEGKAWEGEEEMKEGYEEETKMEESEYEEEGKVEEAEVNEMTLEEILAELEEGEVEEEEADLEEVGTGYEAGKQEPAIEEADEEAEEAELEAGEEGEEAGEEAGEELGAEEAEEVAELSIEEFKDLIRDVLADVLAGHEEEGDLEGGEEDVIGLDEILAELEEEDKKEKVEEVEEVEELKNELHEAIQTINTLKESLNEINLLNAKLLYVNKIFKAKSLTESQKVKVVNAFDRATTTKEAQNIYETLKDSLSENKKSAIKESVGFASKAMGSAPAQPIVEADGYVNRMQILAGIKSTY